MNCSALASAGRLLFRSSSSSSSFSLSTSSLLSPSPPAFLLLSSRHSCPHSALLLSLPLPSARRRRVDLVAASLSMDMDAARPSSSPPPSYRANVGICLVNRDNKVFVAARMDLPDSWQMPQGGVDENEEPREAAVRELREETGVTSAEIIGEVNDWLTYDFPPDVKAKVTLLWGKEWNGQAQKWFLFRFTGDEKEINLSGDGSEKPEFSDWKWLPAEEVIKLAVDFKRPIYEKVLQSFVATMECQQKV